jgi:hypothetical protein
MGLGMHIISHRRNTIAELSATDPRFGVEVDIRSQGEKLIIHHDAFAAGTDFGTWIEAYNHGTLILNVKEEGLEDRLLASMKERGISDFFFLDQSFPFLIKTARAGERRCALRVSEFESIDTALSLSRMVDWVWVDCFNPGLWLSGADANRLREAGFKLCLVSPELQGRTSGAELDKVKARLSEENIAIDAVCTKVPAQWE